jgi:hypothetical protein
MMPNGKKMLLIDQFELMIDIMMKVSLRNFGRYGDIGLNK